MEAKNFIGLLGILTVLTFPDYGKCQSHNGTANPLPRQIEVFGNYYRIRNLSYSEKCNRELESEGDEVKKVWRLLYEHLAKVFESAFKERLDLKEVNIKLTTSQKDDLHLVVYRIEKFTKRVKESNVGFRGICNVLKGLHCDPKIGECLCGESEDVRGSLLVHEDGSCRFDFDSGCTHSFLSKSTEVVCRKGSTCVTRIEKLDCTWDNAIIEIQNHPLWFSPMPKSLEDVCYCERVESTMNIPGNYSTSQLSYSGSVSLHYGSFGIFLVSTALVLFHGQKLI